MENDTLKQKIITESIELFMSYGLRSVTMDDIAKHLGISKKTIYQHFKDKEEKDSVEDAACGRAGGWPSWEVQ